MTMPAAAGGMTMPTAAGGMTMPAAAGGSWLGGLWSTVWDPAAHVLAILIVAVLTRLVLQRFVTRLARRRTNRPQPVRVFGSKRAAQMLAESTALAGQRRGQRTETVASVARSAVSIVVFFSAGLMILTEVGIDIAPVLASAGVLGVALGFGAQNLVKDFLSGTALILEDQLGVGDVVDLGPVTGVVEDVGLRCTQVRDLSGALWFVRNGEILRVANRSRGWSRAVLDVEVAPDAELDRARQVLVDTAVAMDAEPDWDPVILQTPTSWGVESVSGDRAVIRLVVMTVPGRKDDVARELRRRIVPALNEAGIALPTPGVSALSRLGSGQP